VLASYARHGVGLPMDRLHWKSFGIEPGEDGSQIARFEAIIEIKGTGEQVMKLTKTYRVRPNSYLLDCDIVVENLFEKEEKVYFTLSGPGGLGREAFRTDMRKVVAGFEEAGGEISSVRLDKKKLHRAAGDIEDRRLKKPGGNFLWAAAVNKYFAAILVPQPDADKGYCDWVADKVGWVYNPDGDTKANTGDETIGVDLNIASNTLAAAGQTGSSKTYRFQLYIGPKDKSLFDKNEMYRKLGFVHTIDFMVCCCPASIIKPLAFGILWIMKQMHGLWPHNYGIVIIILVFCVRIIMHPVTKKSQVSMSKMQKLAPKAEEIKKKYANNKAEMNKQMMALYREQGASPIMGFLPMMVQMPIWIALWSAVYASIDLRGAAFLPFWITDLSMPDAAWTFPTPITIPLLGWKIESLNLLPILMGVAFYMQQKLMPKQASAATNPQVAQQQKMMMIMMPLLFPLMLYKAPSGVNLYIMASTFAGVIEQHVIRKHIREKEDDESKGLVAVTSKTGGKVKKKKPKPFFKT
jgi:YidC/Oxa1 family membrane protein insertase